MEAEKENIGDRFSFDTTSDELEKLMEGECPVNTAKNNEWAYKNFESWRIAKNQRFPKMRCPDDVFSSNKVACEWLCKYITETRKADGSEYTPRSLYLLLAGLQRYVRKLYPKMEFNLFTDHEFKPLKNLCDSLFKKLHSKGIGTSLKATAVLSGDDEKKLWDTKVLNLETPTGLLRAVFFYNGKNFCLRGGVEQRNLKLSQFQREVKVVEGREVSCYIYTEFGSKNRQGGFNSLHLENKVVCQYQNLSGSGPCHVQILDAYFSKLPSRAKEKDIFYLTPNKLSAESKSWYSLVPVGRNRLGSMLKDMCAEARIPGMFTNHSLRAYGATTLYNANVPKKLIQERTGHRSIKALRQYERTSESQMMEVSNIISSTSDNVQAPILNSVPVSSSISCNEPKMTIYSHDKAMSHGIIASQKSDEMIIPMQQGVPSIASVLKGCNFNNCFINFTGSTASTDESQCKYTSSYQTAKLMEGINIDELFDD